MANLQDAMENLIELDTKWSMNLAVSASPSSPLGQIRYIMKMMEWSMHGVPWFIANIILILFCESDKSVQFLVNLFMALLLDCIVTGMLKGIVQRRRPAYNEDDMTAQAPIVDQFSFPSGHSSRAAMLAMMIGLSGPPGLSWLSLLMVSVFPPLLAVTRVMLGRHYVSDVLAGLIIGYLEGRFILAAWLGPAMAHRACAPLKRLAFWIN